MGIDFSKVHIQNLLCHRLVFYKRLYTCILLTMVDDRLLQASL